MSTTTKAGERKVLAYHDVLLRAADVDLLRGPEWLNDQASCHTRSCRCVWR